MNNEKKEELKAIGVSQEDINKLNVDKEKRNNTVANILKKISFWEGFIGFICFCIILIVFENEGIKGMRKKLSNINGSLKVITDDNFKLIIKA